jgi:hypothetical protein
VSYRPGSAQEEPIPAQTAWEGKIGDTFLRVEVQSNGRIASSWRTKGGNDRRVVVNTVEELERSVLFQIMLTAPPEHADLPAQIGAAVEAAKVGLPDPANTPRPPRKKKNRPPRRPGPRPRRR